MKRRTLMSSALGLFLAPRQLFKLSDGKLLPQDEARADSSGKTTRLVTMYFPNGCNPDFWNTAMALQPLQDLRGAAANQFLILSNVANPVSAAGMRDAHEQGGATLFTGYRLKDANSGTGASIDQVAASHWRKSTALGAPLVCAVWRGFAGGEFRSTSWSRRSWLADGTPVTPLQNPLDTYKTMFGLVGQTGEDFWRKSALDAVIQRYDEFAAATSKLGNAERAQIVQHMEKLREMEKAAARFDAENIRQCKAKVAVPKDMPPDASGLLPYEKFAEAYQLHLDLVAEALSCGITRTASLGFCSAGEEYVNTAISSKVADHASSHYTNEQEKQIFIAYRRFHLSNVVYFANKLQSLGILNSTAIVVGSEFGESTAHVREPQPHLIVGGHSIFQTGTADWKLRSSNDLYRTILKGVGIETAQVGEAEFNNKQVAVPNILMNG